MPDKDLLIQWESVLDDLSDSMPQGEYNLWIKQLVPIKKETGTIYIGVLNNFFREQLFSKGYAHSILERFKRINSQENLQLEFIISEKKPKIKKELSPSYTQTNKHPQLRKEFTFDNFVVGETNRFAFNAALAIAKNPGTAYNPCLIYGGVGLGKTHLMQCIGNYIFSHFDNMKVVYIPAETFITEFIESIVNKKTNQFKKKYRNVDILLIDDIHDLQNKKETQEELFHTFNALYDHNKQMVFTSDRRSSELKMMTDRLRSRFERGLNVDLQIPDWETRYAILKKKLEHKSVDIPSIILETIAHNINSNIRDLEATLLRLIAYSQLIGKSITLDLAKEQLHDVFNPRTQTISIHLIQKTVCQFFDISIPDIIGHRRHRSIVLPRHIAIYIARKLTKASTTDIGLKFGNRDHTTILHSLSKIDYNMKHDEEIKSIIKTMIKKLTYEQ